MVDVLTRPPQFARAQYQLGRDITQESTPVFGRLLHLVLERQFRGENKRIERITRVEIPAASTRRDALKIIRLTHSLVRLTGG
jgi:hypothetical protein